MKELKSEVKKVIDNWYKNIEHDIIHVWEQDDTWFVVIRIVNNEPEYLRMSDELHFCRIFPSYRIEGEYHISMDKKVDI